MDTITQLFTTLRALFPGSVDFVCAEGPGYWTLDCNGVGYVHVIDVQFPYRDLSEFDAGFAPPIDAWRTGPALMDAHARLAMRRSTWRVLQTADAENDYFMAHLRFSLVAVRGW